MPSPSRSPRHRGRKDNRGWQVNNCRRFEDNEIDSLPGAFNHEAMIIFDDVFVPWERVFMFREWEFAYPLVEIFSSYHRHAYGGCKSGLADVIIGAAYSLAKQMGIADKHRTIYARSWSRWCSSLRPCTRLASRPPGAARGWGAAATGSIPCSRTLRSSSSLGSPTR